MIGGAGCFSFSFPITVKLFFFIPWKLHGLDWGYEMLCLLTRFDMSVCVGCVFALH